MLSVQSAVKVPQCLGADSRPEKYRHNPRFQRSGIVDFFGTHFHLLDVPLETASRSVLVVNEPQGRNASQRLEREALAALCTNTQSVVLHACNMYAKEANIVNTWAGDVCK